MSISRVCVYCASSTKVPEVYFRDTATLGQTLARQGVTVVYGGGSVGLMGALADAVLKEKGRIIGVIPEFMMKLEWGNKNATELIVVEDMAQRKKKFIEDVDAVIALPGGSGTLEELSEVISLKKLGLFRKPIIILNTNGFYDQLIAFLERMIEDHFMHEAHKRLWTVIQEPSQIITAIENSPDWTSDDFKFAAI